MIITSKRHLQFGPGCLVTWYGRHRADDCVELELVYSVRACLHRSRELCLQDLAFIDYVGCHRLDPGDLHRLDAVRVHQLCNRIDHILLRCLLRTHSRRHGFSDIGAGSVVFVTHVSSCTRGTHVGSSLGKNRTSAMSLSLADDASFHF